MADANPNKPVLITQGFARRTDAAVCDFERRNRNLPPQRRGKLRGSGSAAFFATITAYDATAGQYSWRELGSDITGTQAVDVYGGGLSLINETVLMTLGADGVYRFCWDRAFEARLISCSPWDQNTDAYVEDPWAPSRQILVHKQAGFYEPNDRVLCVAAFDIADEEDAYKWTIVDRIPMVMRVPLQGTTSGDSGNTAAAVQDDPDKAGCDA